MMEKCPYNCNNKTEFGYCKTTVCIYGLPTFVHHGWVCPKCLRVNAPWVPFCPCGNNDSTQSNDSNTLDALGEKVTE